MRVLFWTDWYLPSIGGVEVFSARLLPALAKRGHTVSVVAGHHRRGLPDQAEVDGVDLRRFWFHPLLESRDLEGIAHRVRQVSELKRALAPDLIHLNTLGPSLLFHLQSMRGSPAPVLLTIHSPLTREAVSQDTMAGRALRSAAWVNCNSRALHADLLRCVPEMAERSSFVYYGMDPPAARPAARPRQPPRILGFGRLVCDKGFDLLLRAHAVVARRRPDARLILAGDGTARPALEHLAASLGLSASVEFTGMVAPQAIPALIERASLVVVPSRWDEPFGLVALEAALMARPVVATRVGGLAEVVEHGTTGILVERDDPDVLASAILNLLEDPATADRLGLTARRRAEIRFSWDECVVAYERLYERCGRRERSHG